MLSNIEKKHQKLREFLVDKKNMNNLLDATSIEILTQCPNCKQNIENETTISIKEIEILAMCSCCGVYMQTKIPIKIDTRYILKEEILEYDQDEMLDIVIRALYK